MFSPEEIKEIQGRIDARTTQQLKNGCKKWKGYYKKKVSCACMIHKKKHINVARFNYEQKNGPTKMRLKKTCKENLCVNPDHHTTKIETLQETWKRMLKHTFIKNDCIVWNNNTGNFCIGETTYPAHRLSFMINKNNGKPIPKHDSDA